MSLQFPLYVEYDDQHNVPRIWSFMDRTELERRISADVIEDLEVEGESYDGTDQYRILTVEDAEGQIRYWTEIAEAMRAGKEL